MTNPTYPRYGNARNDTVDLVYRYTKTGVLDSMYMPRIGVAANYDYDRRKWLDSIYATRLGSPLFKEVLTYDSSGQIMSQRFQHDTLDEKRHEYFYDNIDRLTGWWIDGQPDTTFYTYDAVGNRTHDTLSWREGFYTYGDAGGIGPNRLMSHLDSNVVGHLPNMLTTYGYDPDGATKNRVIVDYGSLTTTSEEYVYSYRNLLRRYRKGPGGNVVTEDWRYRSSANGEREQKRMYWTAQDTLGSGYRHPWVYYLLGASKEQLAVWHGVETCDTMCGSTGERVYLYPKWYLTPALGWNGVREDLAPLITHADGTKEYRISDHLASLRWRLIGDTTTQTFDYNPWGELQSGGPAGATERTFNENERDVETGLYNLGARKYEEGSGRFGSVDPLWEGDRGVSPYLYVGANPVRETDPEGLQREKRQPTPEWNPHEGVGGGGGGPGRSLLESLRSMFRGSGGRGSGSVGETSRGAGAVGSGSDRVVPGLGEATDRSLASSTRGSAPSPSFVVTTKGEAIPVVKGGNGPTVARNGKGFKFENGSGGYGLSPKATGVRIMDPTPEYPRGFVSYWSTNSSGQSQTINPWTGKTVAKADPTWHIPLKYP